MTLDRRQFIQGLAAAGGAGVLGACSSSTTSDRETANQPQGSGSPGAAPSGSADGVLVLVNLDGGNDSLNTVAPVDDDAYRQARGDLALDPAKAHDIGQGFALHPALPRSKALWDAGRFAVVHGVGFAELDRSHFHCRDVWQAGSASSMSTGWVGRWLDQQGTTPIDAVAVGRTLPLLVRGAQRSGAVVGPGRFALPGTDRLRAAIEALAGADKERADLADAVATSNADLLTAVDRLGPALAGTDGDTEPTDGADGLGAQFDAIADLIEADLPTRVFTVEHSGFDTHAGQAAIHTSLLGTLDTALGAFFDRLGDRPVTVAAFSEFGRRVAANASGGTDHGKAGVVLLAGTVRTGHLGRPPGLDRLDDGDLAVTVDFRSVFGGLAEGVLGISATDLFGSGTRPLAVT